LVLEKMETPTFLFAATAWLADLLFQNRRFVTETTPQVSETCGVVFTNKSSVMKKQICKPGGCCE